MLPSHASKAILRSASYHIYGRTCQFATAHPASYNRRTAQRWKSTSSRKKSTKLDNEASPDVANEVVVDVANTNSASDSGLGGDDGHAHTSERGRSDFASLVESKKVEAKPAKKAKKAKTSGTAQKVTLPKADAMNVSHFGARRKSAKTLQDIKTVKELVEKEGWSSDEWKDDWGEDELVAKIPPPHTVETQNGRISLPDYTRRVEGLLESSQENVLDEIALPAGRNQVASLAHGLDRVLFNPGVHWVQDPRSRVYNFPPSIQSIPDIRDFAFDRITPFVKSSHDETLRSLTVSEGKRFAGSTSSLSGLLSHIYFLISQDHKVDTSNLSKYFAHQPTSFTPGQRMPTSIVLNYRGGVYLVDSDSTDNDDSQWNVLLWMGTMLEKFLTLPKDEFRCLLYSHGPATVEKRGDAYRYSKSKTFVMRSQLDCFDPHLPGSGIFDIKTRAALPIRLDNLNFRENSGYLLKALHGPLESFEKEYYDLIRSAFLKYSFQARIGNMDGIFIAYHNTARIFGFQYVSLEEMDERLFGAKDRGWRVFDKCVGMLEVVAQEITDCFPGKTVTCLAETLEDTNILRVWVQPVEQQPDGRDDNLPEISTDRETPIIQLDIVADNYVDGKHVGGQTAVNASDKPWTVHWSISRSSLSEQAIRRNFERAKGRKFRPYVFPTGVDSDNVDEFLKDIGFGEGNKIPDIKTFTKAGKDIELLRALSRAGLEETERMEEERKHLEKYIWQQPAYSE